MGTEPSTQACALTRNGTSDVLICAIIMPNQLSCTGQGSTYNSVVTLSLSDVRITGFWRLALSKPHNMFLQIMLKLVPLVIFSQEVLRSKLWGLALLDECELFFHGC